MLENIDVMRMASALSRHAGERQALTARNIAHADTPGYKTQDLSAFRASFDETARIAATRPGHLDAQGSDSWTTVTAPTGQTAPNGNDVSLEREMLRSVEIRQQHDMALAIYRSTLGVLRTSLGRGR